MVCTNNSGDTSIFTPPFPHNLPSEETLLDPQSAPSDSPSDGTSIFPVPDTTAIFHRYLLKAQIEFPAVTSRLSYAQEATLLQQDSMKILLQDSASVEPSYKTTSK